MSTFDSTKLSLAELLRSIKTGKMHIPAQREHRFWSNVNTHTGSR